VLEAVWAEVDPAKPAGHDDEHARQVQDLEEVFEARAGLRLPVVVVVCVSEAPSTARDSPLSTIRPAAPPASRTVR
jgi:hypothetical protein